MKRSGFKRPSYEEAVEKARQRQDRLIARVKEKLAQARDLERESSSKEQGWGEDLTREQFLEAVNALEPKKRSGDQLKKAEKSEARRLLGEFTLACRTRDGNACQFPGCNIREIPNPTMDTFVIEVHHKGTRRRRPDLIYVVDNGICLCNYRTSTDHHGWVHAHPIEAVEMGLLSDRSYELASKEGTLGQY